MVPLLLATGLSFLATDSSLQTGLVATFLVLYTLAYSPGGGVVSTYSSGTMQKGPALTAR